MQEPPPSLGVRPSVPPQPHVAALPGRPQDGGAAVIAPIIPRALQTRKSAVMRVLWGMSPFSTFLVHLSSRSGFADNTRLERGPSGEAWSSGWGTRVGLQGENAPDGATVESLGLLLPPSPVGPSLSAPGASRDPYAS